MTAVPLRVGSLFTGIGGFDLAAERAGMTCAWQVEIDKDARAVLARHWPNVQQHEDVRNVGRHNLDPVDLVCGGFPCQDLSVAGKRAGLAGERSGLWFEFRRILDELRPRWVVIENVPGLLSSNGGADFAVVLRGLVELGYGVSYRILDAQYFGVAQRRRRVFIVGSLGDGRSAEVLFEREGCIGNPAPRREAREGTTVRAAGGAGDGSEWLAEVAPTLGTSWGDRHPGTCTQDWTSQKGGHEVPALTGYRMQTFGEYADDGTSSALKQRDHKGATDLIVDGCAAIALSNRGAATGEIAETVRSDSNGALPMVMAFNVQHNDGGQHRRKDRPNGGLYVNETDTALTVGTTDLTCIAFTERTRAAGRTFEAQEDLAYALTNPGSGGRTHSRQVAGGFGVRRLTPTECERLQGFPDGWTATGMVRHRVRREKLEADAAKGGVTVEYIEQAMSDSVRYRQLGNAVAEPVVEWLMCRIAEAHA